MRLLRVALTVSDKENLKLVKSSRADLLEIRVDQFRKINSAYVSRIIKKRKKARLPLILTIRAKKEGGARYIPDQARLKLFQANASLVDMLDIELNCGILARVLKIAHSNKKPAIVSYHNFKTTPGIKKLESIVLKAKKQGADIVKIAARANGIGDVVRLLDFTLKHKQKKLITISLGKTGAISRLFFPLAGSLLTYAYIDKPFGPGQLPLAVLQKHLSVFRQIANPHAKNK